MRYCKTSKITSSYIVQNDSSIIAFNLKHSLIIVIFSKIYFRNIYYAQVKLENLFDLITTGRERLIRSHSSARFCFELSGNSN